MNKKQIIVVSIALLSATIAGIGFTKYAPKSRTNVAQDIAPLQTEVFAQNCLNQLQNDTSEIAAEFSKNLVERENNMWSDITNKTGINRTLCKKQTQEYNAYFKKDNRKAVQSHKNKLSQETIKKIQAIVEECGLSNIELHLVADNAKTSPAAADTNVLYVTENLFNNLSTLEQKFVIGHELGHIVYQDTAEQSALEDMVPNRSKHTDLLSAISRFREERADVFAMNQGCDYRKGAIEFAQNYHNKYGVQTANTHPKFIQRLTTAQAVDELYQAVQIA